MSFFDKLIEAQTQQSLVVVGLTIFLSIVFIIVGNKFKKADPLQRPSTFLVLVETGVDMVQGLFDSVFGNRLRGFLPYTVFLMFFILMMNYIPLFLPVEPATTDYSVTLSLALVSIVVSQVVMIQKHGLKGYFKHFADPIWPLVPINIIEIFSRVLSMSLRLFCNILSGVMIMGIVSEGLGKLQNMMFQIGTVSDGIADLNILNAVFSIPLHLFFDLFCGSIQALVFTLLTMIFVSLSLPEHEDVVEEKEEMKLNVIVDVKDNKATV
ncbi:MAG: FoF1 ATP synthase subunit a [Erysipelotrichales bacterium]